MIAFRLKGEINHHDGVFYHDTNQQDDANQRDDVQLRSGDQKGEKRARAGRRQRRENGERMNQAFIQNAEYDVNGDNLALHLFQSGNGVAKSHVGGQVKGERDRRVLSLVRHRERRPLVLVVGYGRERHHHSTLRLDEDSIHRVWAATEPGIHLHHHEVLVQPRVHRGNLALAEGVVQRLVNG